jgi:hypothetical protein
MPKSSKTIKIALFAALVTIVSLAAVSGVALAQTASPSFQVVDWSTNPGTLQRGSQFDLTVTIENVGSEDAEDVSVSIGTGNNFVGISPSGIINEIDEGDDGTFTLRGAVVSTITSGYYSIPITVDFVSDKDGSADTDTLTIGVYVQGSTAGDEGVASFTVTDWSANPENLYRGLEFDLTFNLTNVGTWDAEDIVVEVGTSSSFIGRSVSPMIERLQIGQSVVVTVKAGVASEITTGFMDLPLDISFNHPGSTGPQAMTETKNVGLYAVGKAPSLGTITGRPQIVIEDSTVTAGAGDLLLTLTLRNTGDLPAKDVIVNLESSDYFSPTDGSSAVAVDAAIGIGESATVAIPLTIISSIEQRVTQEFSIDFGDYAGSYYSDTQRILLSVGDAATDIPHLLISTFSTVPAPLTPGLTYQLDLQLQNVGDGPARDIFVRLGEDASSLSPLGMVNGTNVQYLSQIEGGATQSVSFTMAVDGGADPGLVTIDVALEYDDVYGVAQEESQALSLQVVDAPYFDIQFYEDLPEKIVVGDQITLPIEVINIGETEINVSTMEVTSNYFAISGGSTYIGSLDGGTSGSESFEAQAAQIGTATVTVTVNYLDDFQRSQQVIKTFSIEIEGEEVAGDSSATPGTPGQADFAVSMQMTFGQRLLNGLLGFFGIGTQSPGGMGGGGGAMPSGSAPADMGQGAAQ